MAAPERPAADRVGLGGEWHLDDEDGLVAVVGDLLAFVSTREEHHSPHRGEFAPRGVQPPCRACRWFEIAIIATPDKYVMHRIGRSRVPRETPMFTPLTEATTAEELVEAAHHWEKQSGTKRLSSPAREALDIAGEYEESIEDAMDALDERSRSVVRRIS